MTAIDNSDISADAGGLALGFAGGQDLAGAVTLGAGVAINNISNSILASINDSTVTAAGNLNVTATTSAPNVTFNPSTELSGNTITLPGNPLLHNGEAVTYFDGGSSNTPIGGLSNGTTYYVIIPNPASPNQIELASSSANATAGTPISLTSAGTGTDHSLFTGEKITVLALGISGSLALGGQGVGFGLAGAGSATQNIIDNSIEASIRNTSTAMLPTAPSPCPRRTVLLSIPWRAASPSPSASARRWGSPRRWACRLPSTTSPTPSRPPSTTPWSTPRASG